MRAVFKKGKCYFLDVEGLRFICRYTFILCHTLLLFFIIISGKSENWQLLIGRNILYKNKKDDSQLIHSMLFRKVAK